jgi:hypothetical protein
MTTGEVLAQQMRGTREWTLLLTEGLEGDDWLFQPRPGLQHALWLCGHVAVAQEHLVFQRCLNRQVLDPGFAEHFPIGGPIKSAQEHDWPAPAEVRVAMDQMEVAVEEAMKGMTDEFLAEPAFGKDGTRHPHYDTKLGAMSHVIRHEAFHAGQLATLRRLLGKPFLR